MFAYHSTDFDVHRNWIAVTDLPIGEWYYEQTSEWTLDYPPLFAYFQWFMGRFAKLISPDLLLLSPTPVSTPVVVWFMRVSVILSDLLLWGAVVRYLSLPDTQIGSHIPSLSVVLGLPFFLIDSVHFQYNAYLTSWLVFACYSLVEQNIPHAVLFLVIAILHKHLFVTLLPGFAVWGFAVFLRAPNVRTIIKATLLGAVPIILCFPFFSHLSALVSRLFPFGRGLVHAFWAPNIWPLYIVLDTILARLFGVDIPVHYTRGLVGTGTVAQFAVLPNITPLFCNALLLLSLPLVLFVAWRPLRRSISNRRATIGIIAVVISGMYCFIVGWHVHEKALLYPTALFLLAACGCVSIRKEALTLGLILGASCSTLLFRPNEWLFWLLLPCFEALVSHVWAIDISRWRWLYHKGLTVCAMMGQVPCDRYPFLPLMLISLYCVPGVLTVFVRLLILPGKLAPSFEPESAHLSDH